MTQDSGIKTQDSAITRSLRRSAALTSAVAACIVLASLAGAQEPAPRRPAPSAPVVRRDTTVPLLTPPKAPPPPRAQRRLPLAQRPVTPATPRPMQSASAPQRLTAAKTAAPGMSQAPESMRPNISKPSAPVAAPAAALANRALPQSDAPPPAGSTMRCKDGTYLSGPPSESACSGHQGLAVRLPAGRTPPPQPAAAAQRRP